MAESNLFTESNLSVESSLPTETGLLPDTTLSPQILMSTETSLFTDVDGTTVMELAQNYTLYRAGMLINRYYVPILAPIGLVGNILAFLVMKMPHNRAISCCNFMAALSITDNCMMFVAVYLWVVSGDFVRPVTFYECKVMTFSFNCFSDIGIYIIVFMTLDRCIAVRFPLKMPALCTPRRARRIVAGISVFMVSYTSTYLYTSGIINGTMCSGIAKKNQFAFVFSWVNTFVTSVIPFCSLLVMNGIIIKTVRGRWKNLSQQRTEKSKQNPDRQLVFMLMLISMAFLLLTLPLCVRYILAIMLDHENDPYHNAVYTFVYHLSQKLYYTNNAVNFYLYCIGGAKFRADLAKVCGKRPRRKIQRQGHAKPISSDDIPTVSAATMI